MDVLKIASESLVVLYDKETGRIVHTHRVVTFEGADPLDAPTRERHAVEQLRLANPKITEKPEVLHAPPASMKEDALYRVDVKKKMLVEIPSTSGG